MQLINAYLHLNKTYLKEKMWQIALDKLAVEWCSRKEMGYIPSKRNLLVK
jgi:hypothetical protein